MMRNKSRYPKNWKQIAFAVKEQAQWRCCKCSLQCIRPGEDTSKLTKSERAAKTLTVHHWNRQPEDSRLENLVALCTACHCACHTRSLSNISPGQLSLFDLLKIDQQIEADEPNNDR